VGKTRSAESSEKRSFFRAVFSTATSKEELAKISLRPDSDAQPLMRLLLVEDSSRLRRSLALGLRKAGYTVDDTGDGHEGLWKAETGKYDLIILDIMLPTMNGLEILTALRAKKIQTHVLFLTARDSVDDRVRGLRAGADDYLVKPFALTEFLARVEALCRRSYEHKSPYVEINNLRIELDSLQATVSGQKLDLLPREFRILQLLMLRPGKVLTRSYIEDRIYDENKELMSNVTPKEKSI
jgi:DNA-binding response OmpR family regulator